ncbi:FkbM family methyltransferase [Pseudomonas sp. MDT1-16]
MKTIKREGIDVGTALSSTSKRMQSAGSVLPEDALLADLPADPQPTDSAQSVAEESYAHGVNLKAKIKRVLRLIAKHGYRRLKPFIKPIAFRIRQYFLAGFSDQSANITRQQQATTEALLSRIEALENYVASMAAGQRLAAEQIDQLACAPQVVPEELLLQIKRIEDYTYASARRVAVNCGPDELMIRSEIGFVLCSASDHALIATLLEAGELEPGTRRLIHKILKPGDVYVDIGANIGMHMLAAAQAMQGCGKIIGFEPFGPTKALIDKTMWINGFSGIAETHQLAVSNKSGSQSLNLGATSGHHSLFKLDTPAALAKPPVQVDLISLDEMIKPDQVIHLLKIDAEGAELDVIEGAKRLLKNNPQIKLIVELGLSHLERTGHTVEDWLEKFSTLGFDYQVINANSGELETYSIEELKAAESVNLFFYKAKTAALETKHEE